MSQPVSHPVAFARLAILDPAGMVVMCAGRTPELLDLARILDRRNYLWIWAHTSCRWPGKASSSVRHPPRRLRTLEDPHVDPARARLIGAATAFGPEPTKTARRPIEPQRSGRDRVPAPPSRGVPAW